MDESSRGSRAACAFKSSRAAAFDISTEWSVDFVACASSARVASTAIF